MRIELDQISKHFDKTWIFKNLSASLALGDKWAVLGGNGSGKSTLLKVVTGYMGANSGKLKVYNPKGMSIPENTLYQHVAIAAPYLQLLEDLTVGDLLKQQARFVGWYEGLTSKDILALCLLEGHERKAVKNLSSGMKQRLKLGLSILSNRPLLFLDEPASNLDRAGAAWYRSLLDEYSSNRIVTVCSNQPEIEIPNPTQKINIEDYKPGNAI